MGEPAVKVSPFPVAEEERKALMLKPIEEAALAPHTLGQALEWANILSQSQIVPSSYRGKPADVLVAILFGRELGMSVVQSLQNVAVIGGRAAVWGDAPLGIVRSRAGDELEVFREGWEQETETAWCEVKRKGGEQIRREFSMAEARKIKVSHQGGGDSLLVSKDTWRNYPRRMCKFKARNEALRDAFPDILLGIATREEADEWVDAEVVARDGVRVDQNGWQSLLKQLCGEDEATGQAVAKGFDTLSLSPAERVVWLRKYAGNAEGLLSGLKDEYSLRATKGKGRVKKAESTTAPETATPPESAEADAHTPAAETVQEAGPASSEPTPAPAAVVPQPEAPKPAKAATKPKFEF